mmetsp:Transcript_48019/g.112127  ORF Transcript_48019/g.112127 Transcript_48019/m.112127 type:complete len:760 (+) Transcript_48019:110-2389(+)
MIEGHCKGLPATIPRCLKQQSRCDVPRCHAAGNLLTISSALVDPLHAGAVLAALTISLRHCRQRAAASSGCAQARQSFVAACAEVDGDLNPADLSNLAASMANSMARDDPLIGRLVRAVKFTDERTLTPPAVSKLAWSFARLQVQDAVVFERLAVQAAEQAPLYGAQELSCLSWALGKVRFANAAVFETIAEQALYTHSIASDPKGMLHLLSASTRMQANLPELLPAAIDLLSKCRHKLKVFELRSFLISLRRVQTRESGVTKAMQEIVDELTLRLEADDVPCEDIAKTLRVLVGAQALQLGLFLKALGKAFGGNAASAKDLVGLMEAVSRLHYANCTLFANIARRALCLLEIGEMEASEASLIAISFAKFGYQHKDFAQELVAQVGSRRDLLPCGVPARVMFMVASAEEVDDEAMQRLRRSYEGGLGTCIPTEAARAKQQAVEILQGLWPLSSSGHLSPALLALLRERLVAISQLLEDYGADMKVAPASAQTLASSLGLEGYSVALDLPDRVVLCKSAQEHENYEVLPSFAQTGLGTSPIVTDARWDCGRLEKDAPGPALIAKSYAAYFDLRLQIEIGQVARDQLLLLHGWKAISGWFAVNLRIGRCEGGGLKVVREDDAMRGQPAVTQFKAVAHLQCDGRSYTLAIGRTASSRQHQVRIHAAAMGHPVVCDGVYSHAATAREQLLLFKLGNRSGFTHHFRLSFMDQNGRLQEAFEQVPLELLDALSHLSPKDAHAASTLARLRTDSASLLKDLVAMG